MRSLSYMIIQVYIYDIFLREVTSKYIVIGEGQTCAYEKPKLSNKVGDFDYTIYYICCTRNEEFQCK